MTDWSVIHALLDRREKQTQETLRLLGHLPAGRLIHILLLFIDIDRVDEMIELWKRGGGSAAMTDFVRSCIRKGSARVLGPDVVVRFCHLGESQPLLLIREPSNPKDGAAIRVCDLGGLPCGYVAREDAAWLAPRIDAGEMWLAKTDGPCACIARPILLWKAETEVISDGYVTARVFSDDEELEDASWGDL